VRCFALANGGFLLRISPRLYVAAAEKSSLAGRLLSLFDNL